MMKGNNSSKKGALSANSHLPEHYRSQSSKASSTNKNKQKFSVQNMKQFKYQIDHEIAKCLDTLDRQGLKFLKETLRASKLFGLNTQELGTTQMVEEEIEQEYDHTGQKEKSPPKKKQVQKNIQIKKVTKPQPQRKPATSQKPNRIADNKSDLGEKIHKKLESMNIKTGKKNDSKQQIIADAQFNRNKEPKISPANEIQQEIEIQEHHEQQIKFNAPIKNEEVLKKSVQYQSEKIKPINKVNQSKINLETKVKKPYQTEALQRQTEEVPIKPFCKKPFKKTQGQDHKLKSKDYGIEMSKEEQLVQSISPIPQQLFQEKKFNIQKVKQIYQENQSKKEEKRIQQVYAQQISKNQSDSQQRMDPQILNLITKINKLSPNKRLKLQKLLEKLEDPYIQTSMLSIASNSIKQEPVYLKPFNSPKQSFLKQSNNTIQKSKSRTKFQKMQKATSIKKSLVKKIQTEQTPITRQKNDQKIILNEPIRPQGIIQFNLHSKKEEVEPQKAAMSNNLDREKKSIQNLSLKQPVLLQSKQQISPSLVSLQQQNGQKLIKIGKKKTLSTNITIKILSNNGHASLVGLMSILIYNQTGEIVLIDETNIRQYNPKLLKLFTEFSEGWTSQLSNACISVQNILQPIGGIRIFNFNKSELQSNKQADLVQIFVNDQLHWRGQLKGGSYKQDQSYITDIKISSKQFLFPNSNNKSLTTSKFFQQKSLRASIVDPKIVKVSKDQLGEAAWLEKDSISKKMKQIQQQEKNDSNIKKIQSVRGTAAVLPRQSKNIVQFIAEEKVDSSKVINNNKVSQNIEKNNKFKLKESDDILGELSKSIVTKKKQSIAIKEEPVNGKKKEEYLLLKEKQQDDQFQKILKSFQKREAEKPQQKIQKPVKQYSKEVTKHEQPNQSKGKLAAEKCFEDFMKDSLFDDLPKQKKVDVSPNNPNIKEPISQQPSKQQNAFKKSNDKDLDNLIDELNDVVGTSSPLETGEQFTIPEQPKGKELTMVFLSNWGNQGFTGLNGIQIFNSNGDLERPIQIISSSLSSRQLIDKLFKTQLLTSDEQMQLKLPKIKKNVLQFNFGRTVEIAAMRIWNYNGHRVHSNIGIRKCHLKLDNQYIFSGQIQQSTGSSQDAYKYCEYILFTENTNILKKIKDKDWLSRIRKTNEDERILFKTTLQNFHRPPTRNDEESVKKEIKAVQVQREPIKLPKRLCFQYEPPQLPEGFVLKFLLNSSWGDRFFIGLNGIQIFNDKGQSVTNNNLNQIRAEPSSISKLQGYQGDKRVVNNLINNRNNTTSDSDIWLAPLLSDVQKIEKGRSNIITIEYSKSIKISGINFYNYTKTPERGVREIQIYLDRWLLYRGYLRKYNVQERVLQTTINFTKDQNLLQAMNYIGYNEDHLEQDVGLINQQKVIRQSSFAHFSNQKQLVRPMTGKLLM